MNQYIRELLGTWCPEEAERVLEVGCGTGFWLELLTRIRDAQVVGVRAVSDMRSRES